MHCTGILIRRRQEGTEWEGAEKPGAEVRVRQGDKPRNAEWPPGPEKCKGTDFLLEFPEGMQPY